MTRFRRPNTVETAALVMGVICWPLFWLGHRILAGASVVGRAQTLDEDES